MNRAQPSMLLQYLRKLVAKPDLQGLSDRELLQRFAEKRDEAAFTRLVHRHGPMVLGLCQRLLQNAHDAEDVCQATFLVLASKASSRHWQPSIASWLHRVAYHLAQKTKTAGYDVDITGHAFVIAPDGRTLGRSRRRTRSTPWP